MGNANAKRQHVRSSLRCGSDSIPGKRSSTSTEKSDLPQVNCSEQFPYTNSNAVMRRVPICLGDCARRAHHLGYSSIHFESTDMIEKSDKEIYVAGRDVITLEKNVNYCIIEPSTELLHCCEAGIQTDLVITSHEIGISSDGPLSNGDYSANVICPLPPTPENPADEMPPFEGWPPPPDIIFKSNAKITENVSKPLLVESKECQTLTVPLIRSHSCNDLPQSPKPSVQLSESNLSQHHCICCYQGCGSCEQAIADPWRYALQGMAMPSQFGSPRFFDSQVGGHEISRSVNNHYAFTPRPAVQIPHSLRHLEGSRHYLPCSALLFLRETDQLRVMMTDPEDRRIRAVCDRFLCDFQPKSKGLKSGFVHYAVEIAAPSLHSLQLCVRNLDVAFGWSLSQQLNAITQSSYRRAPDSTG